MRPALVEMPAQVGPVVAEPFAPILYVIAYDGFDEALNLGGLVQKEAWLEFPHQQHTRLAADLGCFAPGQRHVAKILFVFAGRQASR